MRDIWNDQIHKDVQNLDTKKSGHQPLPPGVLTRAHLLLMEAMPEKPMNNIEIMENQIPLRQIFAQNNGRVIHKWDHYFNIYERHFSAFRGKKVTVVEMGVNHGGSLRMWKDYFGPQSQIIGVDINPKCKQVEEEGISVVIGDQGDRNFLQSLRESFPQIDILIDDGGHMMQQQIVTFEELFPHLAHNGVYLCEDLHTSYWKEFKGGLKRKNTFIEYSKNLIDFLNAWHSQDPKQLPVNEFTRSAHSLHYYDSVLVIEKRPMEQPQTLMSGTITL